MLFRSQKKIDDLSPSYAGKMVVASCIIEGSSLKAYHMVKVEDFLDHWTAYYYITNSNKKKNKKKKKMKRLVCSCFPILEIITNRFC